ncbi:STAS domain-containing protein [Dactylosporangium sp. NPDC000244]|uniref:STAS domain-containing protein n=1 Tax=Dactylosporangium sp. NPDC000244 TaxID=3154365 RepID=UPI0033323054
MAEIPIRARREPDGGTVLAVRGEVDVATAPALREAIVRAVDGRPARVVIDLAAVSFMDSSALGVLISGYKYAQGAGVAMVLASPGPGVYRLLRTSGMVEIFEVVDPPDPSTEIRG